MPHVEQGELHALLDGAYRQNSPDALRIRGHLQSCADCRVLLEEETTIRGRANELLEIAAPRELQVPPFADVQARATQKRARFNPSNMSWAALVVLALGLGWFGRDLTARKEAEEAAQGPGVELTAPAPAPSAARPEVEAQAPEEAAPAPSRGARLQSTENARKDVEQSQTAQVPRTPAPSPPPAPVVA